MLVTEEIEKCFEAGKEKISLVELTYKNGGRVSGSIRKLRLSPLRLVIQKSDPQKGERPRHKAVFDHVTELKIVYLDESENVFTA